MNEIPYIFQLNVDDLPRGKISRYWLRITTTALGNPVAVPVMAARGRQVGPVLGVTAALHGNEVNGIPVIQQLFRRVDITSLCGTLIGAPVLNMPSFLARKRIFTDSSDLNRIMPGSSKGNEAEVYAHRLLERLLLQFEYHIDLHTASFGRVNSYYVRADMMNSTTAQMARLQNADIIVNTSGQAGTLRPFMSEKGIKCITVELCDPQVYQKNVIQKSLTGIRNVLIYLGMLPGTVQPPEQSAVECGRSSWIYTDRGGLLEVFPNLTDPIEKGQKIARLVNVFGDETHCYSAPENGIVVGKSSNPVNQTGARIVHVGIPGD